MTIPEAGRDRVADDVMELVGEFASKKTSQMNRDMTFDEVGISSLDALQIVFRIE
mgnify:CR=1 FL=1